MRLDSVQTQLGHTKGAIMRLPLLLLLGLLSAGALALALAQTQEAKKSDKALQGKETAHSKLFRDFEPKALLTTCQAHYGSVDGNGTVGDFTINESPVTYRKFNAEGTISADKLKQLLAALKADLQKLAKASGVEKVDDPSDKVEDRPIRVLRAMFFARQIDPSSVRGFYLTYTDGKLAGAIDVIAALDSSAPNHWLLVCAVHEVVPK
jgi:hypothetical protein